jgi:hypothetical protein
MNTSLAVITTTIAALVGFITLRQWLTDRARLKHELFDRRYAIYEKIAAFPAEIMLSGTVEPGADLKFLQDTKLAYFAFGCDEAVKGVVDKLYRLAVDLHAVEAEFPGLTGKDRSKNLDKQGSIKRDLAVVLESLPGIFTKYLKLGH